MLLHQMNRALFFFYFRMYEDILTLEQSKNIQDMYKTDDWF